MQSFIKSTLYSLLVILVITMLSAQVQAKNNIISIDTKNVTICQAFNNQTLPPDFMSPDCQITSFYNVDPQNNHIWVKANLKIPKSYLTLRQATAFFLFAKTSSDVYFNGVNIGQNGTPDSYSDGEFAGKMDARFYVSRKLLREGDNEVTLRLSSHHGLLNLIGPMHFAGISEYGPVTSFFQKNILLSLLLFGVLLSGAVYLAAISILSTRINRQRILFLMVFFVLCQLFSEMSRGLFNYSYPLHDLRLILVTVSALGFGICLLWLFACKFAKTALHLWIISGSAITLLSVFFVPSYDLKAAIAVLIPALTVTLLIAWQFTHQPKPKHSFYLVTFVIFDIVIFITMSTFHSILFYFIVTALMLILFVQQAREFNIQKTKSEFNQRQVAKLQFTLAQNEQKKLPQKMMLNSAGKTDVIETNLIVYCKAAGDYVELVLNNDRIHLYSGSLKKLDNLLPDTFLRVHRSYIVNLDCISALNSSMNQNKEKTKNSAVLVLNNQQEIPVSRRLMPQVRQAINQDVNPS